MCRGVGGASNKPCAGRVQLERMDGVSGGWRGFGKYRVGWGLESSRVSRWQDGGGTVSKSSSVLSR